MVGRVVYLLAFSSLSSLLSLLSPLLFQVKVDRTNEVVISAPHANFVIWNLKVI